MCCVSGNAVVDLEDVLVSSSLCSMAVRLQLRRKTTCYSKMKLNHGNNMLLMPIRSLIFVCFIILTSYYQCLKLSFGISKFNVPIKVMKLGVLIALKVAFQSSLSLYVFLFAW